MATPAIAAAYLPFLLSAGTLLGAVIAVWLIRLPRLALTAVFISLVIGQTIRFPLPGQGGGVLVSDIAVVLILLAAFFRLFALGAPITRYPPKQRTRRIGGPITGYLIAPFLMWSLFTLVLNASRLGADNFAIAFSYWLRLGTYILLLPALLILFKDHNLRRFAFRGLILTIAAVTVLGFLQLWLVPNLDQSALAGWDPHQGRLVSTWLDPNFVGGFLAMALPFVVTKVSARTKASARTTSLWIQSALALAVLLALLLTQSRSSLLALVVSILILSPFGIARLLRKTSPARIMLAANLAALFFLSGILAGVVLGPRALGLIRFDDTAQLRLESLQQAWQLAQDSSLLGVGYNAYQFSAQDAGFISHFTIHSRAGADSSWLTLWVTTGIIGVILFTIPWAVFFSIFLRRWLAAGHRSSFVAATAIIILFVHSQLVNSFLYGHLLIFLAMIIALAASSRKSKTAITVTSNFNHHQQPRVTPRKGFQPQDVLGRRAGIVSRWQDPRLE